MFGDFYDYLWTLAGYAKWLLTGGPFLMDTLVKKYRPDLAAKLDKFLPAERRRQIEIAFLGAAIFIAGFLAWRDEHIARIHQINNVVVSRRLDELQKRNLKKEFIGKNGEFPLIVICTVSGAEPERYAYDFVDMFEGMQYKVMFRPSSIPLEESDRGLMIGVVDKENQSEASKKFTRLFFNAGFRLKQAKLNTKGEPLPDYDLFIGLPEEIK